VQFQAARLQTYLVVVDGFNGAKGNARLNYSLSTNAVVVPPVAPVIQSAPAELTVRAGGEVVWSVGVSGTSPLSLSWWHDDLAVLGQTSTNLSLTGVDLSAAGQYRLVATNGAGAATSAPVVVRVLVSPSLQMQASVTGAKITFPSAKGLRYWLEFTDDLGVSGWHPLTNVPAGEPGVFVGGGDSLTLTPPPAENRFYRLHVE
jgi:hypothetical protein